MKCKSKRKLQILLPILLLWAMTLVDAVNAASPTFTSTEVTSAEVETTYTYTARGSDSDGDWITYSVTSKPDWLNVSGSTPITTVSGTLGTLGTPAGGTSTPGNSDGGADGSLAINAKHRYSNYLQFDNSGVLHISDNEQNVVRRIDEATGEIYTVAGQLGVYTNGTTYCTGGTGNADLYNEGGTATAATLCEVNKILFDTAGNLILSDYGNLTIRKVTKSTGLITTIMGQQGVSGTPVMNAIDATSGPVHQAWDMALDKNNNNIYIADTSSNIIRKYDSTVKTLTAIAGLSQGHVSLHPIPTTEAGLDARLNAPVGLALNAAGTKLYFSERFHHVVRELDTSTGSVTVIAGDRTVPSEGSPSAACNNSFSGDGGQATSAQLNEPKGLVLSPDEKNLFISDACNHRIRKVDLATGIITTVAGTGVAGTTGDGSAAILAQINKPNGMDFSPDGDLYFGDAGNNAFRKITNGIVLSGTPTVSNIGDHTVIISASDGLGGVGTQTFSITVGTKTPTFTSSAVIKAEEDSVYSYTARADDIGTEWLTYAVTTKPNWLSVGSSTALSTVSGTLGTLGTPAGGTSTPGNSDGGADGSLALNAKHRYSNYLQFDNSGVLHISDNEQNVIRRIDEATGKIYTVAGQLGVYTNGTTYCTGGTGNADLYNEGGTATAATLCEVNKIVFDSAGNLILSDYGNLTIRKVTKSTGLITTIMGQQGVSGTPVLTAIDATSGPVHQAWDMAIDKNNNNIYIADTSSNIIRKYDSTAKTLTAIAGLSQGHVTLHPIPLHPEAGLEARLHAPVGMALNAAGTKLYFSERYHHLVRELDTATNEVAVIAGDRNLTAGEGANCTGSFSGDGGLATSAQLNEPKGLRLSLDETKLYISDACNHRIRMVNLTTGIISTVAGTGISGTSGDGGGALSVQLNKPNGMDISPDGDLYFGDATNHAFRKITKGIVLSGTPSTSDIGTHTVTVTATDGEGNIESQTFDITVTSKTPTFTSTALTTATEDSIYTYTARANDVNVDWLTYAVTTAPAWLSVGSSTALSTISGTLGMLGTPAGGTSTPGNSDGGADGSLALNAKHRYSNYLQFDNSGILHISDNEQNVVRRIDESTGLIYTVAGQLGVYTNGITSCTGGTGNADLYAEAGSATAATLCEVNKIVFDSDNNLILSDYGNLTIRKVTKSTGVITTIMGQQGVSGTPQHAAIDATSGPVHQAWDMALDKNNNNIYIANTSSNIIRKYDSTALTLTVIAGKSQGHVTSHPIPLHPEAGLDARLYAPTGLAINADGTKLYFSERYHHVVRVLDTVSNKVTVIAGDRNLTAGEGDNCSGSFSGDGGLATSAQLNEPKGLRLSLDETKLYISDACNHRIRKVDLSTGIITTDAGIGTSGTAGDGDSALLVQLNKPNGLDFSSNGDLYFGDAGNNAFRKITNGIILSGTPTNADVGTHTVTVTNFDGVNTGTQTFSITVANINDAPTITGTYNVKSGDK